MLKLEMYSLLIILLIYLTNCYVTLDNHLQCKNHEGKSVDWFIVYKLPRTRGDKDPLLDRGSAFSYFDSENSQAGWTTSKVGIDEPRDHAVYHTLQQIYQYKTNDVEDRMHVMYNDEKPDSTTSFYFGHTKGTLSFDGRSGFWLVHSVPKFPPVYDDGQGSYAYPHSGLMYGQTMLCVSFAADQLEIIGYQFLYTTPWIYSSLLPGNTSRLSPTMSSLIRGEVALHDAPWSRQAKLTSLSGQEFTSFAKHRQFGADLYDNFVAPSLKQNLFVESWQHGKSNMPSNCSIQYKVMNIKELYLQQDDFTITDDHAKWCLSYKGDRCTVCIGDINRQYSQEHRGGGTLCMCNAKAHFNFKIIVKQYYNC